MERQRRERRYILPDEPAIIVHPNWAAKSGKFDCSIMSLSVLLDYRLEDNKEHSFEVMFLLETTLGPHIFIVFVFVFLLNSWKKKQQFFAKPF